jgi:hypothetical protein
MEDGDILDLPFSIFVHGNHAVPIFSPVERSFFARPIQVFLQWIKCDSFVTCSVNVVAGPCTSRPPLWSYPIDFANFVRVVGQNC